MESALLSDKREDIFILDTGCTRHMVREDCKLLKNEHRLPSPVKVMFADSNVTLAHTSGTISLGHLQLKNVLKLKIGANLISVRNLAEDHGITTIFTSNGGSLFHPHNPAIPFELDTETGLYVLRINKEDSLMDARAYSVQALDRLSDQELHELLGHASSQALQKLFQRSFSLKQCQACSEGKMRSKKHFRRNKRELRILSSLHSDIVYAGVRSVDGSLYFCTVMDEASKFVWIILLRSKKHLHEALIPLIKKEQRKCGVDVCKLTTDGGTEYASNNLENFLTEEGIDHSIKAPYDHAANGTIENCNQRIENIAGSILMASGLSLSFWSYAVEYATTIYNCIPNSSLNWKSPHEALHGKQFNIQKLILFGSKAMVFSPKEIRKDGKFSAKAQTAILLGLNTLNHTYYVYLPEEQIFSESQTIQTGFGFCTEQELKNWNISRLHDEELSISLDEDYEPEEESSPQSKHRDLPNLPQGQHLQNEPRPSRKAKADAIARISELHGEKILLTKALPLNLDSVSTEPKNVHSALLLPEWKQSMEKEINALKEFGTWTLIPPDNTTKSKLHRSIWVFKRKGDGTAKSRLTFDGSTQTLEDVYSSVGSKTSLRAILKLIVQQQLKAKHMDISNAFIHGDLQPDEYVKMTQPPGFREKGKEDWICLVKKSLYGLKQAPRVWSQLLNKTLKEYGVEQLTSDPCVWVGRGIVLFVYVDDIVSAARFDHSLTHLFNYLQKKFPVKDLGFPSTVLGIQIEKMESTNGEFSLQLHQESYCNKIVDTFIPNNRNLRSTPLDSILQDDPLKGEFLDSEGKRAYQRIVGSILYLAVCTRPDLSYASSMLGRFSSQPRPNHLQAANRVLEYIRGTSHLGLSYKRDTDDSLQAFADSDHCSETDRLSRNGFIIFWGKSAVIWGSKKFSMAVPLSSAESEFYAATLAGTNSLFVRNLKHELINMKSLNHQLRKTLPVINLWIDNMSCIKVLERDGFECGTKHIDIRHMWIKMEVKKGNFKVRYVRTQDQIADIFTKPLKKIAFTHLKTLIGLK
jgi:hypothetical protein